MNHTAPTPDSFVRRRQRRTAVVLMTASFTLLLGACSWTSSDQYFVHWGRLRADVVIRERTSWDLTLARELFHANNDRYAKDMGNFRCHANRSWSVADRCVFKLLHSRTQIDGLGGGIWARATSDVDADEPRLRDFREAFHTVIRSVDNKRQWSDCLTMSHSTVRGQNWTVRVRSDRNCRIGRHAWDG